MDYIRKYLEETARIVKLLPAEQIAQAVALLQETRKKNGRVFCLGVGGSAANASHAVNDLRKICGIEAYAPTDNVAELTARINDDGWDSSYSKWLEGSRLSADDAVWIFSVGGGDSTRNISKNLVEALKLAKKVGAKVLGVVGPNGGYTREIADVCVCIPCDVPDSITPHTEAFQGVVSHLLVSHPALQKNPMKWESVSQTVK